MGRLRLGPAAERLVDRRQANLREAREVGGIGGFRLVLWGTFFRTVAGLHASWIVNSVSHIWGSRRFETRDTSKNNWWVALLTFGYGWHNNHHAYPTSARHGFKWYEIDFNWWGIRVLQLLGLARRVKTV